MCEGQCLSECVLYSFLRSKDNATVDLDHETIYQVNYPHTLTLSHPHTLTGYDSPIVPLFHKHLPQYLPGG